MSWLSRLVERRAGWQTLAEAERINRPLVEVLAGVDNVATESGVTINEITAQALPDVWACHQVICQDIARVTRRLVAVDGAGNRTAATSHQLWEGLTELANPETTVYDFAYDMQWNLLVYERAYAQIQRLSSGGVQFWVLDPRRIEVDRTPANLKRWRLLDKSRRVEAEWLWNPDKPPIFELRMRSPIRRLPETLGLTAALERYGASFFANGARLSGLVTTPTTTGDDSMAKLKVLFKEMFTRGNAHNVAVLKGDVKYQPFSAQNDEAQFLESRKHQRSVIAGAYRVPPHKIGDLERATFSNIEQQEIEYVNGALGPYLSMWRQALRRDVLSTRQYPNYDIEFDTTPLVQGDLAALADALNKLVNSGVMTQNDARKRLGLNTVEGGDVFLVNGNMVPVSHVQAGAPSGQVM